MVGRAYISGIPHRQVKILTYTSKQADRAAELQNKATAEQRKRDNLALRQTKIKAVQEARIRRGRAKNKAVFSGAQGSIRGGVGSLTSQLGGNFNYLDQSSIFARNASAFMSEANMAKGKQAQALSNVSLFQGVTSAGMTIFDRREDIERLFT